MKKILWVLLLLLLAFGLYWFKFRGSDENEGPKQQPITASKHSPSFNGSIDNLLNGYFSIKNAFVDADSMGALAAAGKFIAMIDATNLDELKKDKVGIFESAKMQLDDIKANTESLVKQTNITEMRQDFRMVSESMYPLLKTIHYEGKMLYWQNCPMAFGEDKEANWISNSEEIVNPYLGKKHPEYKATMLHCGSVKDSIKAQ